MYTFSSHVLQCVYLHHKLTYHYQQVVCIPVIQFTVGVCLALLSLTRVSVLFVSICITLTIGLVKH